MSRCERVVLRKYFIDMWRLYKDPNVLLMWPLWFACGIPLFLTASTLSLWLKQEGLSNTVISVFSICAFPYTIKFLWAPFVDRMPLPFLTRWLGRRRGWLLLSQVGVAVGIVALSLVNPAHHMGWGMACAFFIAFASATQDIVVLAYQVERLGKRAYGAGEAMGVFGYRIGLLVAGAGALYLSDHVSWPVVYQLMTVGSVIGMLLTFSIKEVPPVVSEEAKNREERAKAYLFAHPRLSPWQGKLLGWLYGAVVCPFADFMRRRDWVLVLLIMFCFKANDNLIGNMTNIFFSSLGFSNSEIASASKVFGMAATILGGLMGGVLVAQLGMHRSLLITGLVHGVSIFLYIVMAKVGYNLPCLYLTIALEHITGGMRTTALFAFQMTLCTPAYAATQLALLTSLVHMGRTVLATFSGMLVDHVGWVAFFNLSALLTIPSLIFVLLLIRIQKKEDLQMAYAHPRSQGV
jgi:PAT family beta-lactamase induction signal transducer AmpG